MQPPTHFVVGAAICSRTPAWPLGLVLAFVSHFALDGLPHFEDPSILPPWLSPIVARHWHALLIACRVAVVGLSAAVWWRFGSGHGSAWRRACYMIAGGVLACTPDAFSSILGPDSIITDFNGLAHRWWFRPYLRAVLTQHDWRSAIAGGCMATETFVFVLGLWCLLRGRRSPEERKEPPDDSEGST